MLPDQYAFSLEKLAYLRSKQIYDPLEGTWTRTDGRNRQRRKTKGTLKYKMVNVDGVLYYGHILAYWFMKEEPVPDGFIIDHKDRDGWNCRWSNLRLVTETGNRFNTGLYSNNTAGHRGIIPRPNGKFSARITNERRVIGLGTYATYDEAVAARVAAEVEIFGKPLDELHADLRLEGAGQPGSTEERV